jgi:hypothetical protein
MQEHAAAHADAALQACNEKEWSVAKRQYGIALRTFASEHSLLISAP